MKKRLACSTLISMALCNGTLKTHDFHKVTKKKQVDAERSKILAKERKARIKAENLAQRKLVESKRANSKKEQEDEYIYNYYRKLYGCEYGKERTLAEIRATPKWVNKLEIEAIHQKRKEVSVNGDKYHVDHVIPLRGKLVCGLNVPDNLRIIPARENVKKGNRFNIDD